MDVSSFARHTYALFEDTIYVILIEILVEKQQSNKQSFQLYDPYGYYY